MTEPEVLSPKVKALIEQRRWADLREILIGYPAPDITALLRELDKPERVLLFRLLPRRLSSEVFSYMDAHEKDDLLTSLTDEETRQILSNLSPDDRTALLSELPGLATQRLLNLLSYEDLQEARHLLGYPEESVGRLMTPDYVAVRPEWTVGQALGHIRSRGKRSETINVIYVTDASWTLLDALELGRFILASPEAEVRQIMDYSFVAVPASEDREEAVRMIQHYDLFALPVVDSEGVLLGIVTVDDVLDVAQEETTEDIHLSAAVSPLKMSYREADVWSLYRKRIGWLTGLVLVNLVSAGVIAAYEETLAASIALAFFIPLLIASGGNAGAQSATLMIRALATGNVDLRHWFWVVGRELAVGAVLAVTMGVAAWVIGFFRGGVEVALIVALSMGSIVVVTNLIGALLPFLLARLRLDPAVASNPLITSVADVAGLLIYFSLAAGIMGR